MSRRGFTLIEVIIAITILMFIVVALAGSTGAYVRLTAQDEARAVASQLAQEQLQRVQMDPNYGGLDSTYAGTESSLIGAPGFTRTTSIVRVGGLNQATDHKQITVTVMGPGLDDPIVRTTTVAAP
jgi:prepilin-type N-terminal cleavage/methylation domain-containing protein